jgi:DNA-binding NarL/FixJ family response regulator
MEEARMSDPTSILIADDHAPFRKGLGALFAATHDTELVGEAATGKEAVALAAEYQPDVILMDLHMPELNGIEATRQILATSPHIGILVLTMFDDDASVFAAMQAGARGYLLKGALKAEILRAVRTVASGEAIFGPAIAARLMNYFTALHHPHATAFPELTEREREILALLAQHLTNPEIADRLGLSPKTIRNHISTILNKLQVANRHEAIARARAASLGDNVSSKPRE